MTTKTFHNNAEGIEFSVSDQFAPDFVTLDTQQTEGDQKAIIANLANDTAFEMGNTLIAASQAKAEKHESPFNKGDRVRVVDASQSVVDNDDEGTVEAIEGENTLRVSVEHGDETLTQWFTFAQVELVPAAVEVGTRVVLTVDDFTDQSAGDKGKVERVPNDYSSYFHVRFDGTGRMLVLRRDEFVLPEVVNPALTDSQIAHRINDAADLATELGYSGAEGMLTGLLLAFTIEPEFKPIIRKLVNG